jgi:DNA polymerase elongation subunit (family B)
MSEDRRRLEDSWLWGWDPTPGIVSVWAEPDGRATVWRRGERPADGGRRPLLREEVRYRPWLLLSSLADLAHLGDRVPPESHGPSPSGITWEELQGPGELAFLVRGIDGRALAQAVLQGAQRRLGQSFTHLRQLDPATVLVLPPEEQYLVASGRTGFGELAFDDLCRMQLDLETTGLDPDRDRIFLIAVGHPDGRADVLTVPDADRSDAAEAQLLRMLVHVVKHDDPDVIENHNLHGFDLPFLAHRARRLGVVLDLGRLPGGLRERPAARGARLESSAGKNGGAEDPARRIRYTLPGRELIDTLDAVRRHDFAARDLPGHGLKAVARHLGLASADRELIDGRRIHATFLADPARVIRYATEDVREAAGLARLLGGAAFALTRMVPRRYERLADTGPATGMIDPLLVRAYLRSGAALPAHQASDGTSHSGAALHLLAAGVAHQVVKADVASLYPSLMIQYRIGPAQDRLGVLLALVERLVDQRLAAKDAARLSPPGSPERHTHEAISAAMKLVVNSAYGYLGAVGLTRFADVHAANQVTAHGRALLEMLCRELRARGTTLLEADTDGVYFAMPPGSSEADERRVVAEVAALLPPRVRLEFDGRYAAMLSHEPKNYALLPYAGPLLLRGVAFRSRRTEPFGAAFLRRAVECLLRGDVPGVRAAYLDTAQALRRRALPTREVASRVKLTRTPDEYLALRAERRELPYEALLAAGRPAWKVGELVGVYRASGGRAGLLADDAAGGDDEDDAATGESTAADPRDYDAEYYVRQLGETFATRLVRAFSAEDFAAVFADPQQLTLFGADLASVRPVLTAEPDPFAEGGAAEAGSSQA